MANPRRPTNARSDVTFDGERRDTSLRGRAGRMQGGRGSGRTSTGVIRLWGRHAVEAALTNPERDAKKLWGTREAIQAMLDDHEAELPASLPIDYAQAADLGRLVARDAPHQGLVLDCAPLPDLALDEVLDEAAGRTIVILDQVTDPHNVGAILRSCAAFNVARALETLAEAGYWRIALDGAGKAEFPAAIPAGPIALVLGAEGEGIRRNVVQHCDAVARLPISGAIESLNVSTAAAIALYATSIRPKGD